MNTIEVSTNDPSALVISFGKHKGLTIAELLVTDPRYVEWLTAQSWFADRFAALHAAVQTRGAASDDSPEHNAIQVRFLDPVFTVALFEALTEGFFNHRVARRVKEERVSLEQLRDLYLRDLLRYSVGSERHQTAEAEVVGLNANLKRLETSVISINVTTKFEQKGIDVVVDLRCEDNFGLFRAGIGGYGIEIKPVLGDDYPTVMRQMQRLNCRILLIGKYEGRAVTQPELRAMFGANDIAVVFLHEIEIELPMAQRILEQGIPPGGLYAETEEEERARLLA